MRWNRHSHVFALRKDYLFCQFLCFFLGHRRNENNTLVIHWMKLLSLVDFIRAPVILGAFGPLCRSNDATKDKPALHFPL